MTWLLWLLLAMNVALTQAWRLCQLDAAFYRKSYEEAMAGWHSSQATNAKLIEEYKKLLTLSQVMDDLSNQANDSARTARLGWRQSNEGWETAVSEIARLKGAGNGTTEHIH